MTFLVQIPQSRHIGTDRENERWQRERRRQLDQKNNTDQHRRSISTTLNITRFYFMSFIHFEPEKIYAPWTHPGRNPGAARLSVDCRQGKLWPKLCHKPHQTDLKQFESRMLVMLEIFFSSIPVTSPKDTRSPSKTNRSPFYANHPALDKSKFAIYPCDEGLYFWLTAIVKLPINFFFLKSLFSSTHTHVDHTQINCGLQALGAWISPNWTWIWTLRRDFRHALDVRKWSCWERTYPCSRVAEHRKLSFVFHSRNECWWGQRPSVFPFFTIPMFLNYKIWANQ